MPTAILHVSAKTFRDVDGLTVTVDVTNTGQRGGQGDRPGLRPRPAVPSLVRPEKELKGFAKVALQPGETKPVAIKLDFRAFAYYHPEYKQWITEDGEFDILIASSAADIRHTLTVTLESTLDLPCLLDRESTIREWMADPRCAAVLGPLFEKMMEHNREFFDANQDGGIGMDMMEMMADMTLVNMLAFQQSNFPMPADQIVDGLLLQVHGSEA